MTSGREFDALLRSWFEESASSGPPQGLLESVLAATAHTRPRPAWLVRLGGEPMPVPGTSRLNRFAPIALAATVLVVAILIGIGLLVRAPKVGPSPAPTSAGWTATASMVIARSGHTATLLPDGKVLVAGGNTGVIAVPIEQLDATDAFNVQSSAELYDPSTGTWSATGSMVAARSGHTAMLLPDGKVLVAGGNTGVQSSAELYDPSTGTWTATGNMVTARSGHTATLLPDGKVLVAGGYDVTTPPGIGGSPEIVAKAELYDPSTGTWSATGSMSTARRDHTATRLTNGKVLVVGGYRNAIPGYDSGPAPLNTAELYDPRTRTWSATGSIQSARAHHGATLLPDGKALVEYGDFLVAWADLYDPSEGTWTAIWSPDIGGFVTATLLADGAVLTTFERQDTALYDPATDSWTDNLGTGREHLTLSGNGSFGAGATATLLDDGTVLVAGGSMNNAEAGTVTVETWRQAELYHPGSAR
jgi:N-acetylneuraminic acid mutarotase